MKYKPKKHQAKAIKLCLENEYQGLFMAPGAGKTGVILKVFDELRKQGAVSSMWVIGTKKSVFSTWPKENRKWGYNFKMVSITGTTPRQKELCFAQEADIYLCNYEAFKLLWDNRRKVCKSEMLVLDESSRIKNGQAKTTKTFLKMGEHFDYRYALTGSPAPKTYLDLFSQVKFLDLGKALGRYITNYRNKYFTPHGYKGYQWALREGAEDDVMRALQGIVYTVDTSQLDTPALMPIAHEVWMPEDVYMKVYRKMEKDLITVLMDGRKVTAANAGVATQKLRQMANGFSYYRERIGTMEEVLEAIDEPVKTVQKVSRLHTDKIDKLGDIIEEASGEKCLIGFEFKEDRVMLEEYFKKKKIKSVAFIDGTTSTKRALEIEDDWNAGLIDYLCGQIKSVAHGLNLQDSGCHHIIMYSLTWDLESYEQFIRRVLRPGNTSDRVMLHLLMCKGTIDEAVLANLTAKDYDQSRLFNAFKDYAATAVEDSSMDYHAIASGCAKVMWEDKSFPSWTRTEEFPYELLSCLDSLCEEAKVLMAGVCGCSSVGTDAVRRYLFAALGIFEGNSGTFTIKDASMIKQYFTEIGEDDMLSQFKRSELPPLEDEDERQEPEQVSKRKAKKTAKKKVAKTAAGKKAVTKSKGKTSKKRASKKVSKKKSTFFV